jgi:sigma-E factor negative regulatory protein RseA
MESAMDTHKKIREHISALSDGELAAADLELAMAALQAADGQLAWNSYFRTGDVLRAQGTPELSDGFNAALAARLDQEPLPVRRQSGVPESGAPGAAAGTVETSQPAIEAAPVNVRSS